MAGKSDPTTDAFYREVDEELRQDEFQKAWTKYGNLVIAGGIAIVLAVAGHEVWLYVKGKQIAEDAARYDSAVALVEAGKAAEGNAALAKLATDGTAGYRAVAGLRRAAALMQQGDKAGAVAAWRAIAADSSLPEAYRNAALLLAAQNGFDEANPAELEALLKPLTAADNPWRFSALELTAELARRRGDLATARDTLARLTDDPQTPASLRGRASELLHTLPAPPPTPAAKG